MEPSKVVEAKLRGASSGGGSDGIVASAGRYRSVQRYRIALGRASTGAGDTLHASLASSPVQRVLRVLCKREATFTAWLSPYQCPWRLHSLQYLAWWSQLRPPNTLRSLARENCMPALAQSATIFSFRLRNTTGRVCVAPVDTAAPTSTTAARHTRERRWVRRAASSETNLPSAYRDSAGDARSRYSPSTSTIKQIIHDDQHEKLTRNAASQAARWDCGSSDAI